MTSTKPKGLRSQNKWPPISLHTVNIQYSFFHKEWYWFHAVQYQDRITWYIMFLYRIEYTECDIILGVIELKFKKSLWIYLENQFIYYLIRR